MKRCSGERLEDSKGNKKADHADELVAANDVLLITLSDGHDALLRHFAELGRRLLPRPARRLGDLLERDDSGSDREEIGEAHLEIRKGKSVSPEPTEPMAVYLREISRVPLLSHEEEVELGKKVAAKEEARRRLQSGDYGPEEEIELQRQIEEGERARLELVVANLRLVVSVARRYVGHGLTLEDLIQEGNFGLLRAVEKFDYRRGFRFCTYATWWIRQAVTRAIGEQSRAIRLPAHVVDQLRKAQRIKQELRQALGRDPSAEEMAMKLDLLSQEDRAAVEKARREGRCLPAGLAGRLERAVAKVALLESVSQDPISLETPINQEGDGTIGDLVGDDGTSALADFATRSLLEDQVQSVLEQLTEREQQVVAMRFGINGEPPRTLADIGSVLGISRERVRQIEAKALRKLRGPLVSEKLRDYLS